MFQRQIMKHSATLSLLLSAGLTALVGSASAEPAAPVSTPAILHKNVDLASAHVGFDCSPAPIGGGTMPTIRSNAAGTVAWWYCPTAAGDWRVNWAVATAAQLSLRNLFAEFRAVLAAAEPREAFNAAVARNVRLPIDSPSLTAVWHPFIAEMNAGKPTALPIAGLMAPSSTPRPPA